MAGVTARFAPPAHRYVPGRTARHPEGTFDAIRARALSPTSSATAARNAAWQAGIDLLEAGYCWEAHEVLEPVWMNAPAGSPERKMVQAMIQLANAALKHEMGRPRAALRLCEIVRGHLARAGPRPTVMGIDRDTVVAAVADLECAVAAGRAGAVIVRQG